MTAISTDAQGHRPPDDSESGSTQMFCIGPPGRGALEVVARHPTGTSEVPDSVADGFTISDIRVRAASVRGLAHRHEGTARQDAYAVMTSPDDAFLAMAVCDGVGSAVLSHRAAAAACRTAVDLAVLAATDSGLAALDWQAVVTAASDAVVLDWSAAMGIDSGLDEPSVRARVARTMATTLTVAVTSIQPVDGGWTAAIATVGDSPGWIVHGDEWRPATAGKTGDDEKILVTTTASLPAAPAQVMTFEHRLLPGDVLLLMSDGVGNPLGAADGEVGQQLARWWSEPPDQFTFAAQVAFARQTFVDDRTCVAAWYPAVQGAV